MATLKVPITTEDHAQGPESANVTMVESAITSVHIADKLIPSSSRLRSSSENASGLCFAIFP